MLLLILAIAAVIVVLGYTLDLLGGGGTELHAPPAGTGAPK
jgi:hypothetical protein